jgi:hypothetical protein
MTTEQAPAVTTEPAGGDIVARAGQYYRNTRYIMCALLIGAGLWFAYDGWIGWPEHNRKVGEVKRRIEDAERSKDDAAAVAARTELGKLSKEKSNSDILLQKILACALPPVGIVLLVWALYNSRGAYRLSGRTLQVPGHPPITIDQITRIDKRLWDRKGIAYLDYEAGQMKGRIKLDDFVYDRPPTDMIYERIEREMSPAPNVMEPDPTNPIP